MRKTYLALMLPTMLAATNAVAQEAASVELGSFDLVPSLQYKFGHDDNVTRSSSNEINSWFHTISPEAILLNNYGANQVQIGYRLESKDYFSSQIDNYTDHFLNARIDHEFNSRNRLQAEANWEDGHDDRGTRFSIGNGSTLDEPDQYKSSGLEAIYSYGALTSQFGLDFIFDYQTLDYDIESDVYRARDRDTTTFGGTLRYEVAPLTEVTLDYTHKNVDYDFALNPENPLDSTEDLLLLGVNWESTAQTSGYAKLGYRAKDFDAPGRDTFNGVDWQVGVVWQPVSYTKLDLTTFSNTNETNGEGNFIKSRTYRATWSHDWLERLTTRLTTSFDQDRYEGEEGVTTRSDDTIRIGAGLSYQFRRWMQLNLDYVKDTRSSNRDIIDYDRDLISFTVKVTL
ncbi:outer membrane beta-barrel protein [Alteromonas macleodii]|jgi:polysaccharide biosynthesis protein VpsM|uniref:outer membrane beta-barrel protein n=1 Tax=Alteromonas macleodii TaxID=28108 RepID=UPI00365332E8